MLHEVEEEDCVKLMLHHSQFFLTRVIGELISFSFNNILDIFAQGLELDDQVENFLMVNQQQLLAIQLRHHFRHLVHSGVISLKERILHLVAAGTEHTSVDLREFQEAPLDVGLI
jgi:hypothetical protein